MRQEQRCAISAGPLTTQQFAAKIRAKFPGSYDDLSDADLSNKVLAKYPQYQTQVAITPMAVAHANSVCQRPHRHPRNLAQRPVLSKDLPRIRIRRVDSTSARTVPQATFSARKTLTTIPQIRGH